MMGWIGVDLDGTLATWNCGWEKDFRAIGKPIPAMVNRVKDWLKEGKEVKIITARCDPRWREVDGNVRLMTVVEQLAHIGAVEAWCKEHIGAVLPVQDYKDYDMEVLYDDRAIQVERDTGRLIGGEV
jgi:hypothetical protein